MKKYLLLFLLISLRLSAQSANPYILGIPAVGGITFDSVTELADLDDNTTMSVSHTTGSGSNRFLIVFVSYFNSPGVTISGVTYNSIALTQAIGLDVLNVNNRIDAWYLVAPATGSNTLEVTFSGNAVSTSLGVTTWTGVDQSTPISDTGSDTGVDPSAAVTIDSGDLLMDGIYFFTTTATVGTGQTERWNTLRANDEVSSAGSTEGGSGSITMSWTNSQSGAGLVAVEVNAI